MKICIFTETYYPVMGGGETQAQLLAEGLIDHGHSVILLTRRSDPSLEKHERYGELDVYRLAPVGNGQLKKWGLILSGFSALISLRRQYDLIFVSGYRFLRRLRTTPALRRSSADGGGGCGVRAMAPDARPKHHPFIGSYDAARGST